MSYQADRRVRLILYPLQQEIIEDSQSVASVDCDRPAVGFPSVLVQQSYGEL